MKLFNKICLLCVIVISNFSCAKEESATSKIPYARVDININIIIDHEFNNAFHYKKYYSNKNGVSYAGYAGVIAISNDDLSPVIYAYDLCCPYEAPLKNELEMEGSFKLKCPKCGSVYNLMYSGRAESGPAREKLLQYRVFKDGSFYRIYN